MRDSDSLKPTRIKAFAKFFKSYMSLAGVVAAALPIPVAAFRLLPIFASQRTYFAVYVSLYCFLALAFCFFARHLLSRRMFPMRGLVWLPLVLIAASFACALGYHALLDHSVREVQSAYIQKGIELTDSSKILEGTDPLEIPHAAALFGLYLGIFLLAELAFVLMALKEYLQDVLGLDETELLR